MKLIGNILWMLLGGFLTALSWLILGALWCITIVGIPIGLQCFKFAKLCIWPFGLQFFKFAKLSLMPFGAKVKKG